MSWTDIYNSYSSDKRTRVDITIDATRAQGKGGWVSVPGFGTLSYEVKLGYDVLLGDQTIRMYEPHVNPMQKYDPNCNIPWYGGADSNWDKKSGSTIRVWLDNNGSAGDADIVEICAAEGSVIYNDGSQQYAYECGALKLGDSPNFLPVVRTSENSELLAYERYRDNPLIGSNTFGTGSSRQSAHFDVIVPAHHMSNPQFIDLIIEKKKYPLTSYGSVVGIALVSMRVTPIRAQTYTLAFNTNGGTPTRAPMTMLHWYKNEIRDWVSLTNDDLPKLEGGEFRGWYDPKKNMIWPDGSWYWGNYNNVLEAAWDVTVSFVGNGGSGVPGAMVKRYREPLPLPTDAPQKPGYMFIAWNTNVSGTGASYGLGSSIPANINQPLTLYAMWQKDTDPPTVKSLTTVRCEADGTPSDEGTCCLVTCEWEVDIVNNTRNTGTVTGKYSQRGGEERTFQFRSGTTGTKGTAIAMVEGLDVDTQFTFTVTVTDLKRSTSMSSILTRARFVLDFKTGGLGMGIGSAAPLNGLAIGWETQFDQDVIIYGNLDAKELKYTTNRYSSDTSPTSYEIVNPTGTFSVGDVRVQKVGRIMQLDVTISSTAELEAWTSNNAAQVTSSVRPLGDIGFISENAMGRISSSGYITVTPVKKLSPNTRISVGAIYFVGA